MKYCFAERMKEARNKAGFSQAELSRRTKISAATLSTYESNKEPKNPPIDKATSIAQELNVSLDWLCGLTNDMDNNINNEITFKNVMESIMLLVSLNQVTISIQEINRGRYKPECGKVPIIVMDSQILKDFTREYQKVSELIKMADFDDYLNEELKKILTSKFSDYIVNDGYIQSKIDGTKDTRVLHL